MHHLLYIFEPGAILIVIIVFSALIATMIRGRQIPQCYYCGAVKVRSSRPVGFLDTVATFMQIKSYRCAGCQARFHALRLFNRSRHSPS
jgi:hypothetical protein